MAAKKKQVKTLVIDRAVWLRGEGSQNSYLLRPTDGKRCCLGIYLGACGLTDGQIKGRKSAAELGRDPKRGTPKWLLNEAVDNDSGFAEGLMSDNDAECLTAAEREKYLAHGFAKQGIKVKFVGRTPRKTKAKQATA